MMEGGKKVYPQEGLLKINYKIEDISYSAIFSKSAFEYALKRSHEYSMRDKDKCLTELKNFKINGKTINIVNYHPYKISYGDIKIIDNLYRNFSLETSYGIKIVDRKV